MSFCTNFKCRPPIALTKNEPGFDPYFLRNGTCSVMWSAWGFRQFGGGLKAWGRHPQDSEAGETTFSGESNAIHRSCVQQTWTWPVSTGQQMPATLRLLGPLLATSTVSGACLRPKRQQRMGDRTLCRLGIAVAGANSRGEARHQK
jgi:hypothetical protein